MISLWCEFLPKLTTNHSLAEERGTTAELEAAHAQVRARITSKRPSELLTAEFSSKWRRSVSLWKSSTICCSDVRQQRNDRLMSVHTSDESEDVQ